MSLADWGAVVSPAFIIGGFFWAIMRWAWNRFEKNQGQREARFLELTQENNAELIKRLDAQDTVQNKTLEQATKTNGRVDGLERRQAAFEREHATFRERLSHVEGQAEVLLREKGQAL